jgi:hypothetical protein
MSDFTAPNTGNYLVGKGNVYFTPVGGVRRHVGNAPAFEIELGIEELEHFSSMSGVRVKDLVVIIEKSATVRMTLEEWTAENVAMALLGTADETDTEGNVQIEILSQNLIRGLLEFEGTNDVGPRWNYRFPQVAFRPNAALSPISDEWGTIEMEGEVEAVDGKFGTATLQNSAGTEAPTEASTD